MKLGVNVHPKARGGQEYSAQEKSDLTEFLDALDADAILIMDNFEWAKAYAARLPQTKVVFRPFHPAEGHLYDLTHAPDDPRAGQPLTPHDYYIGRKEFQDPNLIMYVLNEPSTKTDNAGMEKKIDWLVGLMDLYGADKQPLVIDNVGVGHYDYSWFTDNEKWAIIKPLFDALRRYPFMYWGLHEYFSYKGLEVGNGRVGRHKEMARLLSLRGYDMPPVLLTEVGCDQIDDTDKRGYLNSMSDLTFGGLLVEAQLSTWSAPYIKGAMVYCYGSSTTEWLTFDIQGTSAEKTRSMMIASNEADHIPVPPPPPAIIDRAPALIDELQPAVDTIQDIIDKYRT